MTLTEAVHMVATLDGGAQTRRDGAGVEELDGEGAMGRGGGEDAEERVDAEGDGRGRVGVVGRRPAHAASSTEHTEPRVSGRGGRRQAGKSRAGSKAPL